MSGLLPIIEGLASVTSDTARADWLLRCPLSVLITYQETIRNRLESAGFECGVTYLDAIVTVMRGVRDENGDFRGDLYDIAHQDLSGFVARGQPEASRG